ncbi:MAG: hypothetical protein GY862_37010 [Gammaproteobacteria bacterium]|nr:hypothetical protein [Gammaproteobacteria bacterium]
MMNNTEKPSGKRKSSFRDWTLTALDKRFGLKQVHSHEMLNDWLNGTTKKISQLEKTLLQTLEERAQLHVDHWNEQEYALNVIGQLLSLADFSHDKFNAFADRYLAGTVDDEELSGNPDGMIAKGWREPEIPYFCLQEYKRERNPEGDPAGQCLAAMLVAQELNEHHYPVYGCYVAGRNWFFMILRKNEYAISNSYSVTHDEIFDIFRILNVLKMKILEIVQTDT